MKVVNVTHELTSIPLGRLGENERTMVIFDVQEWLDEYPGVTIGLYNQLPNESTSYPAVITQPTDGKVTWMVGATELQIVGNGRCELVAVMDDVVVKGAIYKTIVYEALDGEGDTPEPWESWMTEFTRLKGEAETAANTSEAYAIGTKNGTPVESTDPEYHNNSKYYAEQAGSDSADAIVAKIAAEAAQTAAETAQGKAEDAQEAAENAQTAAEMAQEAAETAQGKAEDAQDAAEAAQGKAEDAQEAAETAQGKAEDAQEAAETAQGKAEDAQEAAETAQGKAEDAQEAAEEAAAALETLIDDTAGAGDTDKVWSADKLVDEFDLKAPKANPVFTGSISMGRKTGTDVGTSSFATGYNVESSANYSHAEGSNTKATQFAAHAEGSGTEASGYNSHAEGSSTHATEYQAHAEGNATTASGNASHSEGTHTTATGNHTHAEGYYGEATGIAAHAEGSNTHATGNYSHAEGYKATADGNTAHAEGSETTASGIASHAEGNGTTATGYYSHAEGTGTVANHKSQNVSGEYNVEDASSAISQYRGNYVEIVGNGTASNNKSNARALDWNGNEYLKGDLYVGCNADSSGGTKVAKITDVDDLKSAINAIEVNNMFDGATWQSVSISTIDGKTWTADQKYYTCLKLPVKAGQHIYMQPNDTYAYRYTMLTYDTEYNFLSASEEILNAVKTGSEFIISADGYIRIMMQNHGKTTITDALKQVYESIPFGYRLIEPLENQVAENQSDIATNQVAIADQKLATAGLMDFILNGSESPHYLLWRNGSFDPASGTVITPNYLYRVSSPYIYEVSERLYYTVKTNYRLYVGVLVNGTWSGSWHTGEGSIAAGIKFVLMIGRTTEDTSETADINEFVNAITFKSNVLTAIDDLKNSVDNLESAIDGLEKAVGDPLKETITGTIVNGFYNVGNNTFTQSANFDTLIVNYENTIADYLYSGNIPNQLVAGATFLNSSDSVISYALVGTSSGGLTYTDKSISTIPDGTSKIAFTTYNQAKLLTVKSVVYGDIYSTKDFVITGDSIETESAGRWAKPLTDAIPFKSYTNCAVGGTCMARVGTNYISSDARVSAMPETADIVLIGGGTNDWGNNVPLGSLSTLNDDSTFAGAVASMITKMQTRYPSALIVFMSNQLTVSPNRHNFDNTEGFINNVGASATDYADMMETVCKYFNIQYINVNHNCAINRLNYTTYILQETNNFNDTVYAHPNDAGAKRMLRIIYNWFRSNKLIE